MIRTIAILLLSLGAIGSVILCISSVRRDKQLGHYWEYRLENRIHSFLISVDGYRYCASYWKEDSNQKRAQENRITLLGFEYLARTSNTPTPTGLVTVRVSAPAWGPFLALAAYPTLAFIRGPLRRWRRRKRGQCINCGYDLTGNESGTCPECGMETYV